MKSRNPKNRPALKRTYKIQEVVKRNQILLVQIVKEERGNKGAALTTYLSLLDAIVSWCQTPRVVVVSVAKSATAKTAPD